MECSAVWEEGGCTRAWCKKAHPPGYLTRCRDLKKCRLRSCGFSHEPPPRGGGVEDGEWEVRGRSRGQKRRREEQWGEPETTQTKRRSGGDRSSAGFDTYGNVSSFYDSSGYYSSGYMDNSTSRVEEELREELRRKDEEMEQLRREAKDTKVLEGRLERARDSLRAVTEELNTYRVREDFGRLSRQFNTEAKDERIAALVRQVEALEERTREDKVVIHDMERNAGGQLKQILVLRSKLAAAEARARSSRVDITKKSIKEHDHELGQTEEVKMRQCAGKPSKGQSAYQDRSPGGVVEEERRCSLPLESTFTSPDYTSTPARPLATSTPTTLASTPILPPRLRLITFGAPTKAPTKAPTMDPITAPIKTLITAPTRAPFSDSFTFSCVNVPNKPIGINHSGSGVATQGGLGSQASGSQASVSQASGSQAGGCQASACQASGTQASGTQASGSQASACQASGTQASASQASGTQASACQASGSQASGSQASACQASGTQASPTNRPLLPAAAELASSDGLADSCHLA